MESRISSELCCRWLKWVQWQKVKHGAAWFFFSLFVFPLSSQSSGSFYKQFSTRVILLHVYISNSAGEFKGRRHVHVYCCRDLHPTGTWKAAAHLKFGLSAEVQSWNNLYHHTSVFSGCNWRQRNNSLSSGQELNPTNVLRAKLPIQLSPWRRPLAVRFYQTSRKKCSFLHFVR